MVLVGGYARQLWVLWIVKAEVTVEAETPAFKQSTQHYFFKKQPLPVVESVEEEDDPGVAVLKTKKILWKKATRKPV